jgi:hypothetical protein
MAENENDLMVENLDLVAMRRKRTVTFPNDNTYPVVPYRGSAQSLVKKYRNETDPGKRAEMLIELLRQAVPAATEDDWSSVALEDWGHIIAAANGSADLVQMALKNAQRGVKETGDNTPHSNLKMTSPISSRGSGKFAVDPGSRSGKRRGTRRS